VLAGPEMLKNGHTFASAGAYLKILDRILSCLLILGGIGHTLGSFQFYKSDQMSLLWSLCASLFVFLFAAVSLIRAGPTARSRFGLGLPGCRPLLDCRLSARRGADRQPAGLSSVDLLRARPWPLCILRTDLNREALR
jgi:hypothetical protein